jgi:hypothetical protein
LDLLKGNPRWDFTPYQAVQFLGSTSESNIQPMRHLLTTAGFLG